MKTNTRTSLILAAAIWMPLALAQITAAAGATDYDSIVSLATNVTKNYTFTDAASGQGVVIAVTMTAYDPNTGSAAFSPVDGATRLGIDGNIIDHGAGANFSASLVSAGSGVVGGSVKFNISGLGVRPVDGAGYLTWTSSVAGLSIPYSTTTEVVQSLDSGLFSLNGGSYSAQMRFPPPSTYFQLSDVAAPGQTVVMNASFTVTNLVDPRTNSWFTTYSGQYARLYTTDLNRTNGNSVTMWTNGNYVQQIPAYCGVQEVYSSSNWVYVRSTGLGSHVMGPWYLDTNHLTLFNSFPTNQKIMFRIPRTNAVPATKKLSGGGSVGIFVDGAAMYNNWDANYWNGTADVSNGGTNGFWNRDAYVNEGASFDPNNAHQPQSGQYHYHANPPGLRYLLGDHVTMNATTKIYSESTNTATKHSPILGWAADGFPIYGPYGYAVSNNASSGIKRMVSGFVPRNGQYGTDNYSVNGTARKYLPQWAARLYGVATNVLSGPTVSSSYPFGRYMEDNDYLGDHGYKQGVDFDLDEWNGRWCITPEFPAGTYAYFVSISTNGTPVYPYNIGFGYYGNPAGGSVSSTGGAATIADITATNFLAYTNLVPALGSPTVKTGTVTLTWSALEGGSYQVEATTNLTSWTILQSGVSPNKTAGGFTNVTSLDKRFYRVGRTSVASYDGAGATALAVSSYAPGGSATRGQTVQITITFTTGGANPPTLPPNGAPVSSVTLGSITGTSSSYVNNTTYGTETANFTIPSNATTGAQTISITFSAGPTFTVNSFTIN
jgi:hypothetical protein